MKKLDPNKATIKELHEKMRRLNKNPEMDYYIKNYQDIVELRESPVQPQKKKVLDLQVIP